MHHILRKSVLCRHNANGKDWTSSIETEFASPQFRRITYSNDACAKNAEQRAARAHVPFSKKRKEDVGAERGTLFTGPAIGMRKGERSE